MAVTHEDYVAKGYCPSISSGKVWCCLPAGHDGTHIAPYLQPNGKFIKGAEWG